jgi:HK97 gp10 family phage protein
MRISVEVRSNTFGAILARFQRGGSAAVQETIGEIRDEAARRSRVKTGAMRDGWTATMTGPAAGTVSNDVPYTAYNEYGTVRMSAQPMLTPAVDHATPRFTAKIAKLVTV